MPDFLSIAIDDVFNEPELISSGGMPTGTLAHANTNKNLT